MSIKIMAQMWEAGPEEGPELLVMLALADIANDDGVCWPSMEAISKRARMSERNARRVIRKLETDGWIITEPGRGRNVSNVYRIAKTGQSVRPDNLSARTSETENRTSETEKPDIAMSGEPSGTIIEPSGIDMGVVPAPKRRKPELPLPEDWVPSERNIADAAARHFSAKRIEDEAYRFRNHHIAKGTRFRDWDAAWRTWLGNAENSARVAEWLSRRSPREVDEAIVSQALSQGVTLTVDCDYRFPRDERGNSLPIVTIVKRAKATGDKDVCAALWNRMSSALAPADQRTAEAWLAELSVIVARRQDDEFTETLRIEAYASRLRRYPADIAKDALLGRSWRFWPAWAELEEICERAVAKRRAMIAALEDAAHREERPIVPRIEESEEARKAKDEADRQWRRVSAAQILRDAGFAHRMGDTDAAERKYRPEAYMPRILEALRGSKPLTRRQIAARIGAEQTSISTAMLELVQTGAVVRLPHTPAVAATYRLPVAVAKHDKRTWLSPKAFAWSVQMQVSVPREPWEAADRPEVSAASSAAVRPASASGVAG